MEWPQDWQRNATSLSAYGLPREIGRAYEAAMRILCTNDDGIHADGLGVLERIAGHFSDDVWVVAPEYEQSGASRALTLTAPVRVREAGPRRFAVSGTPMIVMSSRNFDGGKGLVES